MHAGCVQLNNRRGSAGSQHPVSLSQAALARGADSPSHRPVCSGAGWAWGGPSAWAPWSQSVLPTDRASRSRPSSGASPSVSSLAAGGPEEPKAELSLGEKENPPASSDWASSMFVPPPVPSPGRAVLSLATHSFATRQFPKPAALSVIHSWSSGKWVLYIGTACLNS